MIKTILNKLMICRIEKRIFCIFGERPVSDRKDFDIEAQNILDYDTKIQSFLSDVILVTKLRETRVLTGFSRIKPLSTGDEKVSMTSSGQNVGWLPAVEVRGEGILNFDKTRLLQWYEENKDIINLLTKHFNQCSKTKNNQDKNYARISDIEKLDSISPFFILIHTFSHLFIKQL